MSNPVILLALRPSAHGTRAVVPWRTNTVNSNNLVNKKEHEQEQHEQLEQQEQHEQLEQQEQQEQHEQLEQQE